MHIVTLLKRLYKRLLELCDLMFELFDLFPAIQRLVLVCQVTLFDTLPCELDTLTLIILLVVDALYFFPNVFDIGAEKV